MAGFARVWHGRLESPKIAVKATPNTSQQRALCRLPIGHPDPGELLIQVNTASKISTNHQRQFAIGAGRIFCHLHSGSMRASRGLHCEKAWLQISWPATDGATAKWVAIRGRKTIRGPTTSKKPPQPPGSRHADPCLFEPQIAGVAP